jgi:5-methylthioadenosine/S-adenosylhomocysteine deaminase
VLDPTDGEARRRDLIVRDGVIVDVCEPGAHNAARIGDLATYDATDRIIIPGLINAHTHGHATMMKGVADRWPLEVSVTYGPARATTRRCISRRSWAHSR